MTRETSATRSADLVALFTGLGPAWSAWANACTPAASVSYIRVRLLHALDTDGAQSMTELSRSLSITQRRVTDLVDALTAENLVTRKPHPTDGRSTVVSLTPIGAELQKTWLEHQKTVGRVFEDLTPEQQRQLIDITPVLTEAMRTRANERLATHHSTSKENHS